MICSYSQVYLGSVFYSLYLYFKLCAEPLVLKQAGVERLAFILVKMFWRSFGPMCAVCGHHWGLYVSGDRMSHKPLKQSAPVPDGH